MNKQFSNKQWELLKPDQSTISDIQKTVSCLPETAAVIANRNITTGSKALKFLYPSLKSINTPDNLQDIESAALRIYNALIAKEKILIFGDYDIDGISATAILYLFLNKSGAKVEYYTPHREKEGYGIKPDHIINKAKPGDIRLIITVDCGINDHLAVEAANLAGIDIIITDHHEPSDKLPQALAIINPRRKGCQKDLDFLAGVGVAFYLLIYLRKYLRQNNYWNQERQEPNLKAYCDLVALGTVADMVPLINENRTITKTGLKILSKGKRPGIKALMKISAIKSGPLHSDDIAFRLAPRLNAAGRMDHAGLAVELLITEDKKKAQRLATTLDQLNKDRRHTQELILNSVERRIIDTPDLAEKSCLVFAQPGWKIGVLGIVASKILEKYNRPVILFGMQDNLWWGSGRSIPGFNIFKGLNACSENIIQFGGHKAAAGLKILPENLAGFIKHFEEKVSSATRKEDFTAFLKIDYELNFEAVDSQLLDELTLLEPYGISNPEPVFSSRNIKVFSSTLIAGKHLKMILQQKNINTPKKLSAIWFNAPTFDPAPDFFKNIAYKLGWNYWNNSRIIQLTMQDARL